MNEELQRKVEGIRQTEQRQLAEAWSATEKRVWLAWSKKVWRWSGVVAALALALLWWWRSAWLAEQRRNCLPDCQQRSLINIEAIDCVAECAKYNK